MKQMDGETKTKDRYRMLVVFKCGSSCFGDPPIFQLLGSWKHVNFSLINKSPFSLSGFELGLHYLQRKGPTSFLF